MSKKKVITLLLTLAMILSLSVGVSAAETTEAKVPITLTVVNTVTPISCTVPACLPVSLVDGYVVTANNAMITNTAKNGAIRVTKVDVQAGTFEIGNFDDFWAVITTLNIAQKLLPFFSVPAYYGRFLVFFVLLAISWRTFLAHDRRKMRFICYISRNFLSTHSAAFPARKDNSKSRIGHRNHLRKVRCPPASWLPSFAARIQRRNEFANEFPQVRLTGS